MMLVAEVVIEMIINALSSSNAAPIYATPSSDISPLSGQAASDDSYIATPQMHRR